MTKHEDRRAGSRNKLLASAARCFAEKGYEGCSIADIAAGSGMSQGSIYVHFASKEALFTCMIEEDHISATKKLRDALTGSPSFDALLGTLLECIRDVSYPVDHRLWVEILAQATRNDSIRDAFLTSDRMMRDAFIALFRKAVELGQVDAEEDVEALSIWLYSMADGLIARTAYDPDIDLDARLPVFEKLIRRALGAGKLPAHGGGQSNG